MESNLLGFKQGKFAAAAAGVSKAFAFAFAFSGVETCSNPKPISRIPSPAPVLSNSGAPPPPCNSCFRDGSFISLANHWDNDCSLPGDEADSDSTFSHSSIPRQHFSPPPAPISNHAGMGCTSLARSDANPAAELVVC